MDFEDKQDDSNILTLKKKDPLQNFTIQEEGVYLIKMGANSHRGWFDKDDVLWAVPKIHIHRYWKRYGFIFRRWETTMVTEELHRTRGEDDETLAINASMPKSHILETVSMLEFFKRLITRKL